MGAVETLLADRPGPTTAPDRTATRDGLWSRPLGAVLGVAVAAYAAFIARSSWSVGGRRRFTLFDDAMVSMAYARTFADGHGLVWYPGAPRVEGFTNPVWVGIMAVLHRLGLSASGVSLAVMVLGVACLLGSALLAVAIARRLGTNSRWADAAVAGLVAFCYPLVYWTLRGMEVGLITLLVLAAVLLALRIAEASDAGRPLGSLVAGLAVVFALGVTTRLDFVTLVVAVGGWLAWRLWGSEDRRRIVTLAAVVGAALIAQLLARHQYYGELVPNTYALKATGVPLADRFGRGTAVAVVAVLTALLPAVVLALVAWRTRRLRHGRELVLLAATGLALLAYSTFVGGDAWEWMGYSNRYLVPAVVVALIGAVVAVADLLTRSAPVPARAARGVAVAAGLAVVGPWIGLAVLDGTGLADLPGPATGRLLLVAAAVGIAVLVGRRVADAGRTDPRRAAIVTCVVLGLSAGLYPGAQWALDGGAHVEDDQDAAEFGALLASVTTPDARIAVVWAGAPAYYSGRPVIDLLGKNDRVVAQGPNHEGPFLPGHTKWDYVHSILDARPDVVAQLWHPTAEEIDAIAAAGYVPRVIPREGDAPLDVVSDIPGSAGPAGPVLYVRADSDDLRWSALAEPPAP